MVRKSAVGQNTDTAPHIVVVENWFAELTERVPIN
jgi:hypothetical protein